MTYFLGLTGGIATGKSTVHSVFEKHGIPIIDGDEITKNLQVKGSPILQLLKERFGEEILFSNGELNRARLGEIVFSSDEKRLLLDQLLSPFIRKEYHVQMESYKKQEVPLVVLDVPLLFEKDYLKEVDEVMVVYTPVEIQLGRLMARNSLSNSQALERIHSQMDIEEKKDKADVIVDNSGSVENTMLQVESWIENFIQKGR